MSDARLRSLQRFVGGVLMTSGGVVAVLWGLCAGCSTVKIAANLRPDGYDAGWVPGNYHDMWLNAGLPALVGVGLFLVGRAMRKSAAAPDGRSDS